MTGIWSLGKPGALCVFFSIPPYQPICSVSDLFIWGLPFGDIDGGRDSTKWIQMDIITPPEKYGSIKTYSLRVDPHDGGMTVPNMIILMYTPLYI